MYKVVLLQALFAVLGVACCTAAFGGPGAASGALAGAAYVVPNALFAWSLHKWSGRWGGAQAIAFLVGEAAKILVTVAILVVVAWLCPAVHWGAVVIGLIVTLQANFLVFLVKP